MKMPFQGRLSEQQFYKILLTLLDQKSTGILTVQGDEDTVSLIFDLGMCVEAESHYPKDSLRVGELMKLRGFINDTQLHKILEKQTTDLKKFGYIAREFGFITTMQLMELLEDQKMLIIFPCLTWTTGLFHFREERSVSYDKDSNRPLDLTPFAEIGDEILKKYQWLKQRIPSWELIPVLIPGVEVVPHGVQVEEISLEKTAPTVLKPGQEKVYNQVNGVYSIRQIIHACHQFPFQSLEAMADLQDMGVIEIPSQDETISRYQPVLRNLSQVWTRNSKYIVMGAGVLIVIIIFSLLPFRMVPSSISTFGINEMKIHTRSKIDRIRCALAAYYLTNSTFPEFLSELVDQKYLQEEDLRDAWGAKVFYRKTPKGFLLTSEGSDRVWATEDDIKFETEALEHGNVSFFPGWISRETSEM